MPAMGMSGGSERRAHHKVTKNTKPAVQPSRAAYRRMSDSVGVAFGHAGKASEGAFSPRQSLDLGRFVNFVTLWCTSLLPPHRRDSLAWHRSRKITFRGIAIFGQKRRPARDLRRGKMLQNVTFRGQPLTLAPQHGMKARHPSRKDLPLSPKPAPTPSAAAPSPAAAAAAPAITPNIIAEHGLTADEYKLILSIMGREPNLTELGIFSVMWSEHCSYKSSKVWLKKLPTTGPAGDPGPGRERRRDRYRRRARRRLQDGEPQPPLLHRALPGRGHRRRRHHARRLHHGRPADRQPERARASAAPTIRRRGTWWPAWSRASAATATAWACPPSAAR